MQGRDPFGARATYSRQRQGTQTLAKLTSKLALAAGVLLLSVLGTAGSLLLVGAGNHAVADDSRAGFEGET
jgi:hypothetical protein